MRSRIGTDRAAVGAPAALAAAATALVLGALVFMISETVVAHAWSSPSYSYTGNYISDLGNPQCGPYGGRIVCSPWHTLMNGAFLAQGLLLAVATWLLGQIFTGRSRLVLRGLGAFTAGGFVLTGIWHSSPQATADGTLWVHYFGATLAILGSNTLAILVSRQWRRLRVPASVGVIGVALGSAGLVAAVTWLATFGKVPPGIPERAAVYPIMLWELALGGFVLHVTQPLLMLRRRRSSSRPSPTV